MVLDRSDEEPSVKRTVTFNNIGWMFLFHRVSGTYGWQSLSAGVSVPMPILGGCIDADGINEFIGLCDLLEDLLAGISSVFFYLHCILAETPLG